MSKPQLTPSQRSQLLHDVHTFCINPHTREIFLHSNTDGDKEEEPGVDYWTAVTLEKNLSFLHHLNGKPIVIHMHSPGGHLNDGLAIYDAIKYSKCHVTILAYAHASSTSSIILQAADTRILLPNTEVLIHYGDLSCEGTAIAAQSLCELNKRYLDLMLKIYTERCINGTFFKDNDKKPLQVRQFLHKQMINKQDWYLDAFQAVDYGFADYIIGGEKYPNIASCLE